MAEEEGEVAMAEGEEATEETEEGSDPVEAVVNKGEQGTEAPHHRNSLTEATECPRHRQSRAVLLPQCKESLLLRLHLKSSQGVYSRDLYHLESHSNLARALRTRLQKRSERWLQASCSTS